MLLVENLERILASGTDNPKLRVGLASAYFKRNDFESAQTHLERAAEQDPELPPTAWRLWGRTLQKLDRTQAAANAYQKGIERAESSGEEKLAKEMQAALKKLEAA